MKRLTFFACCNRDVWEKFKYVIIFNTDCYLPYKGNYGRDIGLEWNFNKKAWITQDIFFGWLQRLNTYIALKKDRKILVLIDKLTSHGKTENIPSLRNVGV